MSQSLLKTLPLDIENNGVNNQVSFVMVDKYELIENSFLLTDFNDVEMVTANELFFLQDDENAVLKFSERGKVAELVARSGRGPFEATKPDIAFLDQYGRLSVWDANLLKLMKFSKAGTALYECTNFRWAINDLAVIGNHTFFYNSGNPDGPIVKVYRSFHDECPEEHVAGFGSQTEAHKFLTSIEGSVGMSTDQNRVYYMSPSSLDIHKINLKNYGQRTREYSDSDFYVPEIKSEADIWSGKVDFRAIMRETSIVEQIIVLDEYIIVMAEIGKEKYNEELGFYTAEDKKTKVIIFNKDLKYIDEFAYSHAHNGRLQTGNWFRYPGGIAYISREPLGEEPVTSDRIQPYTVHLFEIHSLK